MRDSLIGLFERVFRMTCRLYPSEFKQRLGRDLRSTFVAECEKAHARGGVPHLLWYGVTNIVATPGAALAECLKTDEYRTNSKRGSTLVSGLWQDVRVAVRETSPS